MPISLRWETRLLLMQLVAALFPVTLALLLSLLIPAKASPLTAPATLEAPLRQAVVPPVPELQRLQAENAGKLEQLFARHDYRWPPSGSVPALAVAALPHDLGARPVAQKKALFFRTLLPLVIAENRLIRQQRQWLESLPAKGGAFSPVERERLLQLAQEYGVKGETDEAALLHELLMRVDELPPALVLAQAANESGWGTSRFAIEVNNLFGEWTFKPEHGVAPRYRPEGSRHYVRRFHDLRHSVRSYLNNLNSSRAYRLLREMRAAMRGRGEALDALLLAEGLKHYSTRGAAYIDELRAMIVGNRLNELGPLRLARSAMDG